MPDPCPKDTGDFGKWLFNVEATEGKLRESEQKLENTHVLAKRDRGFNQANQHLSWRELTKSTYRIDICSHISM